MDFKDRIGHDAGANKLEDALTWAAANGIHYIDINTDRGPNHMDTWTDERISAVKATCQQHDIHLGNHTLSGVNVAEFSPFLSDAVDEYLKANIDLSQKLGASGQSSMPGSTSRPTCRSAKTPRWHG